MRAAGEKVGIGAFHGSRLWVTDRRMVEENWTAASAPEGCRDSQCGWKRWIEQSGIKLRVTWGCVLQALGALLPYPGLFYICGALGSGLDGASGC